MSGPFGYDGGGAGDGGQQGNEGHPAWQEYLQELPEELHSQVTPVFEKWDKGVQERFQKVHSTYDPWKSVISSGVDPNMAQFGINLLSHLEDNPKYVYDALGQYYKFNEQGQGEQGQENPQGQENNEPWRGEIDQLRKQNQILASHALQRQEAERQAAADKALDQEFSGLKEKYGDYDELWVLSRMGDGRTSAEDAVKQYHEWLGKVTEGYKPKPLIMGAGGGVLGQNADVSKMSDAQRKSAAVQMLQAMNAQRQQ